MLPIFSISKVASLSLHPSGRVLLVLYENNMIRLWNMLDGRCTFKKKLGLNPDDDKRVQFKVKEVKWETSKG